MRKRVILALPVLAFAAACGGSSSSPSGSTDYAPNFVGTYSGTQTASFTSSTTGQTSTNAYQTAFQIFAGVAASDLALGGSCGLTGHASSTSNFITFQNTCTSHDAGTNCDYTYYFQAGTGTKNGTALTMSIPGTYASRCPLGNDSGTMNLVWNVIQQ
jgi:hypothetical protein